MKKISSFNFSKGHGHYLVVALLLTFLATGFAASGGSAAQPAALSQSESKSDAAKAQASSEQKNSSSAKSDNSSEQKESSSAKSDSSSGEKESSSAKSDSSSGEKDSSSGKTENSGEQKGGSFGSKPVIVEKSPDSTQVSGSEQWSSSFSAPGAPAPPLYALLAFAAVIGMRSWKNRRASLSKNPHA